jgi:sulfoxide reductase catalytic subunit YedY
MLIRRPADIRPSEITPPGRYRRRQLLRGAAALGGAAAMRPALAQPREKMPELRPGPAQFGTGEKWNTFEQITSYCNFYEFGTGKNDPLRHSKNFRTRPWSVAVDGEVRRPQTFAIEDLLRLAPIEERVYRLRCVEGWSMVIPWVGYPFAELARRVEPTGNARYVEFRTLLDPQRMPGQKVPVIQWPYLEGLRIDEAMHPLTILSFGLYGELLPNPNGAPLRLVVPWKYGFKGAKSIVRIRFVDKMPVTSWMQQAPHEYGFYSNVNPTVDHPRWSQARERRIGELRKRETLLFNGYGDHVARLYAGLDLRKFF